MAVVARLSEIFAGFAAQRKLPHWRRDPFRDPRGTSPAGEGGEAKREVVLFADTFNRYFEPENIEAAMRVLAAAGYRVHLPKPLAGRRPLCCGRTFLSVGLIEEARREAERTVAALAPFLAR